jgi:tetratricopeptide (TPR) repeat protein
LNQLANIISSEPQAWFNKFKHFKVTKAVYASYNAFSKVDVVVACHLPGTVSTYVLNGAGEKVQEDDKIWLEAFASSVMRALLTTEEDDEQVNAIVESRNLNPFSTPELGKLFLHAFEELFFEGVTVGSTPEIQTPTLIDNYFADAFLQAVEMTGLFDEALEVLERLRAKEESVVTLIVKVLLLKDEEVKAVKAMFEGIKKTPRDSALLLVQSKFLTQKGQLELALQSAISAVNSAPSEFNNWANLSKVYLELGDIEQSLFTLNACPMAGFKEKFHLKRMIPTSPDKLHLPLPTDVHLDDVGALDSAQVAQEHKSIDQALINLPGANLKSTFAKAYDILTQIVHKTGWEALLKYRARIFVMEEEYRSKSSSQTNVTDDASDLNSFKKKRLCERWLDNLFMLLYDDLKTYTMWQAEMIHFQAQKTSYEKLPLEWEYLGMCAFRLHHYKEAATAFQHTLESRFSPTSTRNLLKYYKLEVKALKNKSVRTTTNGNINSSTTNIDSPLQVERKLNVLDESILDMVVRLTAWNHRWYCEFAPFLLNSLAQVVERQGLVKVQNEISVKFPDESGVNALMADSFEFIKLFDKPGSDS